MLIYCIADGRESPTSKATHAIGHSLHVGIPLKSCTNIWKM